MKSYGIRLLFAIIGAFVLSTVSLYSIFLCLFPNSFSPVVGPTKKRDCQENEHIFSMMPDHGAIECSRCRRSVYAGAICRNCDKMAVEIFKKEHSCFISGIGDIVVIPSGHGYRPDNPSEW